MPKITESKNKKQLKIKPRGSYKKNVAHQSHQFYNPLYSKIVGSLSGGLLLSKLMYHPRDKIGDMFKYGDAELIEELCLGSTQLQLAKRKLKDLGFITIERIGLPSKAHYRVHANKITEHIKKEIKTLRNRSV